MVLDPYVASSFRQHSAMSAARVAMNITRIYAYPVIAKLSDVSKTTECADLTGDTGLWPRGNVHPVYPCPDPELHSLCHQPGHWSLLCESLSSG